MNARRRRASPSLDGFATPRLALSGNAASILF
jgi:hypothetical protein